MAFVQGRESWEATISDIVMCGYLFPGREGVRWKTALRLVSYRNSRSWRFYVAKTANGLKSTKNKKHKYIFIAVTSVFSLFRDCFA